MSKVCITTVVDRKYMAYAPLFVYCLNKAYPNYHCRLFMRDTYPYAIPEWGLNAEIVSMFEDYPRYEYLSIALRFAIDKECFKEFDYVYVTDIDMMLMKEDNDIEYFHRAEMESTGLCYSNSIRNASHYAGTESLTGLHFVSREWFEKTNDVAGEYRQLMKDGLVGLYREYDGVMLYRIAQRSGLKLPGKYKLTNRHHGIHLGNFRLFPNDRYKLETRIPPDYRNQWMKIFNDRALRDICETCRKDNSELNTQLIMLERFCRGL